MWDKELDDDYKRYWKYGDNIISPVDTFKSGIEENDLDFGIYELPKSIDK